MNNKKNYILLVSCIIISWICISLSFYFTEPKNIDNDLTNDVKDTNQDLKISYQYDSIFPQHEPYGTGIGVMPGRVVWSHNPDSVEWNGEGYWWNPNNFNEEAIQTMLNNSIISLSHTKTIEEGWSTLFTDFNTAKNNEPRSYQQDEKIAIKTNMNGSGVFDDDASGKTKMSYTNPVLLKALLISLVENAHISPANITVYDVSRVFPDYMVEMCSTGILSGINFEYRDALGKNDAAANRSIPIIWSQQFSGDTNYVPTCVSEASYLINLANLKGHSYGITLSAKNHFGSLMNTSRLRPPEAAGIHRFLTNNQMNSYTVLVDLLGNYQLGGKTFLYMLDALICAPSEGASITGENSRWQQAPFNNDFTSSIFVSQDPIALDSVGADFLINEPAVTNRNSALKDNPNVENYLHEGGLVSNPPSKTIYYNGNGIKINNLGVHEHWNNTTEKLYSRNLGKNEGIELIKIH